jgi:hypothetical protein
MINRDGRESTVFYVYTQMFSKVTEDFEIKVLRRMVYFDLKEENITEGLEKISSRVESSSILFSN